MLKVSISNICQVPGSWIRWHVARNVCLSVQLFVSLPALAPPFTLPSLSVHSSCQVIRGSQKPAVQLWTVDNRRLRCARMFFYIKMSRQIILHDEQGEDLLKKESHECELGGNNFFDNCCLLLLISWLPTPRPTCSLLSYSLQWKLKLPQLFASFPVHRHRTQQPRLPDRLVTDFVFPSCYCF